MKRVRGATLALLAVAWSPSLLSSCAVGVEGDFGGVAFTPDRTVGAILDSHEILERNGALIPVERARASMTVNLWLSSAEPPMGDDWRRLPAERLLDVRKDLAGSDLLVVQGLSFDALQDGDRLTAVTNAADGRDGIARGTGDFTFALGQRVAEQPADGEALGLGGKVTVEIEARQLVRDRVRGGTIDAVVTVTRERAAGQPEGGLATGTVTLQVAVDLAPERLAEANLAIVAPIARCLAVAGPDVGLACAAADADPVVDATGSH